MKRDTSKGTIYVPVNFTHAADMDGLGCAFLTKIVFENLTGGLRTVDPDDSKEPPSFDIGYPVKRCGRNYIVNPIIVPMGYNDQESKIKEAFEELNNIRRHVENPTIPIIIYTDISEPANMTEMIATLDSFGEEGYIHWCFDHHATNPRHGTMMISPNCSFPLRKPITIPREACIVDSQANVDKIINAFINAENESSYSWMTTNQMLIKHMIHKDLFINNVMPIFNDKGVDRSAMFIYYAFLNCLGLLFDPISVVSDFIVCVLNHLVYFVSHADTYWFDNPAAVNGLGIPYPLINTTDPADQPTVCWDYYSVWFGTSKSFSYKLHVLVDRFINSVKNYAKGFINYDKYKDTKGMLAAPNIDYNDNELWAKPNLPDMKLYILPPNELLVVNRACRDRDDDFHHIVNNKVKVIDFPVPMILPTETKIIYDCALVIYGGSMNISYIGNRICNEYPVSIIAFLEPSSCLISFRSSKTGITVNDIAKEFGGGGHPHAAGASVSQEFCIELLRLYWNSTRMLQDFTNDSNA